MRRPLRQWQRQWRRRRRRRGDACVLDEMLWLGDTLFRGRERDRVGSLRQHGQAETGNGGAAQNSRNDAAAIDFLHQSAPRSNKRVRTELKRRLWST
jgi:hypothetical protein